MNQIKLIGIVGKKQSGKDTIFAILKQLTHEQIVIRLAFADKLKLEVSKATGTPIDEIEANKVLYRPILQWWGTEFRRGQDTEYWIKKWEEGFLFAQEKQDVLTVCTDVRFSNEAQTIRKNGGILVRVTRPGSLDVHEKHSSETEQDAIACDWSISNSEGLDFLKEEVQLFMERFNIK